MAVGTRVKQGKTAFVTDYLQSHPDAKDDDVRQAWTEAGNDGTISGSLIYKMRREAGLTGKWGSKGGTTRKKAGAKAQAKPSKGTGAERATATEGQPRLQVDGRTNRGRQLAEIEGDIDRLIFKLMGVGGMETIEEELRRVRRRLIMSQG